MLNLPNRVLDVVLPVNPINGKRHFTGISREVEKWIGNEIFYPMNTGGLLSEENTETPELVKKVFQKIYKNEHNKKILNPDNETEFDYRISTVNSTQLNAFAVPGGGMVIYTQLVNAIQNSFKNNKIKEIEVTDASGDAVKIDMSEVTQEDVLAAVIAHEMTHIASRHSFVSLAKNMLSSILESVVRSVVIFYLKNNNEEYKEAVKNDDTTQINKINISYNQINTSLKKYIGNFLIRMLMVLNSRTHEYEADITGAFLAAQAGYNPQGALYLQEIFNKMEGNSFLRKNMEFLYTHPHSKNRQNALHESILEYN